MIEILKAGTMPFGLDSCKECKSDNGYMYSDSNDIPKHIVLISEIYKLAKLHITDFMRVEND